MDKENDVPQIKFKRRTSILKQTRQESELDMVEEATEEETRNISNETRRSLRRVSFSDEVRIHPMNYAPFVRGNKSIIRDDRVYEKSDFMELDKESTLFKEMGWFKPACDVQKQISEKHRESNALIPGQQLQLNEQFCPLMNGNSNESSNEAENFNRSMYINDNMSMTSDCSDLNNKSVFFKTGDNDMSLCISDITSTSVPDVLKPQPSDMSLVSFMEELPENAQLCQDSMELTENISANLIVFPSETMPDATSPLASPELIPGVEIAATEEKDGDQVDLMKCSVDDDNESRMEFSMGLISAPKPTFLRNPEPHYNLNFTDDVQEIFSTSKTVELTNVLTAPAEMSCHFENDAKSVEMENYENLFDIPYPENSCDSIQPSIVHDVVNENQSKDRNHLEAIEPSKSTTVRENLIDLEDVMYEEPVLVPTLGGKDEASQTFVVAKELSSSDRELRRRTFIVEQLNEMKKSMQSEIDGGALETTNPPYEVAISEINENVNQDVIKSSAEENLEGSVGKPRIHESRIPKLRLPKPNTTPTAEESLVPIKVVNPTRVSISSGVKRKHEERCKWLLSTTKRLNKQNSQLPGSSCTSMGYSDISCKTMESTASICANDTDLNFKPVQSGSSCMSMGHSDTRHQPMEESCKTMESTITNTANDTVHTFKLVEIEEEIRPQILDPAPDLGGDRPNTIETLPLHIVASDPPKVPEVPSQAVTVASAPAPVKSKKSKITEIPVRRSKRKAAETKPEKHIEKMKRPTLAPPSEDDTQKKLELHAKLFGQEKRMIDSSLNLEECLKKVDELVVNAKKCQQELVDMTDECKEKNRMFNTEMEKTLSRFDDMMLTDLDRQQQILAKDLLRSCGEQSLLEIEVKKWSSSKIRVHLWKSAIKLKTLVGEIVEKPECGPWNILDDRVVLKLHKSISLKGCGDDVVLRNAQQMVWQYMDNMSRMIDTCRTVYDFIEILKIVGDAVTRSRMFYSDVNWIRDDHKIEYDESCLTVWFAAKKPQGEFCLTFKPSLEMYNSMGGCAKEGSDKPISYRLVTGDDRENDVWKVIKSVPWGRNYLREVVAAVDDWLLISCWRQNN